ncbi:CinA family protein [bacterium]|nr:CinA family protein [bacterium]
MFDRKLKKLAKYLIENNLTVSTAESCTGGLLSSRLTDVSGSSDFVKLNFVTYANFAKESILDVDKKILEKFGAVSEECAYNMAAGLHKKTNCDMAICTTGIAGPTGGTKEKPVGLAYISVYFKENILVRKVQFPSFIPRKLMKFLFTQKAISFACKIIEL